MEKINIEYLGPATTDTFKNACHEFNVAIDRFREAQITELKYQLQYLNVNVNEHKIKEYTITDPLSNIGAIIYNLFPDKK